MGSPQATNVPVAILDQLKLLVQLWRDAAQRQALGRTGPMAYQNNPMLNPNGLGVPSNLQQQLASMAATWKSMADAAQKQFADRYRNNPNLGDGSGMPADLVKKFNAAWGEAAANQVTWWQRILQVLGNVVPGLKPIMNAFAAMPPAAAAATAALIAVSLAAKAVALSSPATFRQFSFALQDMAAVIGHALVPLLQAVTKIIRGVADAFATQEPYWRRVSAAIGKVVESIAPLFVVLAKLTGPVWEIVATTFELLALSIESTINPIMALIKAFDELGPVMKALVDPVGAIMNMVGAGTEGKSSVGAAVRQASYSSIEELGRRSTISALGGTAGLSEDGKATTHWLKKISDQIGGVDLKKLAVNSTPLPLISDLWDVITK